jgi:hypothetical protein
MSYYTLENLWNFSDDQIKQILVYFNNPILNTSADRLNAVILSFNNNILTPEEKNYVTNPEFYKLFLATDQQLQILAEERGLSNQQAHIEMIKYIIDNINAPVIPVVNNIPGNISQPLVLYRMGNNLYLCGSGTFNIKEQLKSVGGIWNPNIKCWEFPLNLRDQLLNLINSMKIPSIIPEVSQIPFTIPDNLQIYQANNQVLLCGNRTYGLQDRLRAINGKFEKSIGCWIFSPEQAINVLNIYNEAQQEQMLKSQRIQEQRQLTRQENMLKRQTKTQEDNDRMIRMRVPESEAYHDPYINRIPTNIIEEARRNGTYDNLYYNSQQQDINELRPIWNNKIQIFSSKGIGSTLGQEYVLTYLGDTKPPDSALMYKANNWEVIPFGGSVKRIDYKKYKVYINGTD